jgi:hypothetical protein
MSKNKMQVKRAKKHAKGRHGSAPKSKRLKQNKDGLFGFMAGQFEIVGDIESPIPD